MKDFKTFLHKNILLFIVFITGAAVLILEVTATRTLSAYFGSTIYTVSSVISVILLALSVGYYVGGRLADAKGSLLLFYGLIALSGFSVFILQILNITVSPAIAYTFSLRDGPLVLAMMLFFLPSVLLGMLSPIVAKLQKQREVKGGIGRVTGDVFFWSTLGSILGSLGTGFVLIPHFGVDQIIIGVGLVLVVIGLGGISISRKDYTMMTGVVCLVGVIIVLQITMAYFQKMTRSQAILYSKDSIYEKHTVYDSVYKGKPTRFFRQDIDASSAMYLHSSELVYDYTKYYKIYTLNKPDLSHALIIGAGAYSIPKALLADDKKVVVDVVDIEPALYEIGKQYFNVPNDSRLVNNIEDGRRFLHDTDKQYDLIFGDAFHFSIPPHLTTTEFFQLTKDKLAPEGMFVMNVIGSLAPSNPSFVLSEMHTFKTIFPNSYFFATRSRDSNDIQNLILVGYNSDKKLDFKKAESSKDPILQSLAQKQIDEKKIDFDQYHIFTDNYAPVEYYISKNFN